MSDFLGAGAGPMPLGPDALAGDMAMLPVEIFQTAYLDLTQVVSGIELIPAKPGYAPQILTSGWIIDAVTGTQTTPVTTQAGNDGAHSNIFPSASTNPTNTDVNTGSVPCLGTNMALTPNTTKRIANAPVYLDITTGAQGTGGFSVFASLFVYVMWLNLE